MKQEISFIYTVIQINFCRQWFKTTDCGGHDRPIWWWMNSFDLSVASLTLIGLEMSSTALSAVPEPMSSHTRQHFPPFQVQCRVTLDRAFRLFRFNVESHSTALSAVPDPVSRNTRQRFPPFQFPMSSHTRHRFPLFQVQWRVTLDSSFRCSKSNIELISILFIVFMTFFISSWNCEEYRRLGKLIWIRVLDFIRIIWTAWALRILSFCTFLVSEKSRRLTAVCKLRRQIERL